MSRSVGLFSFAHAKLFSSIQKCKSTFPFRRQKKQHSQELAKLSLEDTVSDELSLLGDLGRSGHFLRDKEEKTTEPSKGLSIASGHGGERRQQGGVSTRI